jgi:hypothetical protein
MTVEKTSSANVANDIANKRIVLGTVIFGQRPERFERRDRNAMGKISK